MDSDAKDLIQMFVRSGFYEAERIIEILCQEAYAPGELDESDVRAAVQTEFSRLRQDERGWPSETDCDRLDRVFDALSGHGLIALQNAGYTQSDGYEDCMEVYRSATTETKLSGYCFYHGQDLERAVKGGGLYLAFGPIDAKKEQTEGPVVGRLIVAELERLRFRVEWNGTFSSRMFIPRFDWKRRIR